MTHGEMYVLKRDGLDFSKSLRYIEQNLKKLPKRMSRDKAMSYYGSKIKQYFEEMNQ